MKYNSILFFVIAAAAALLFPDLAHSCPNCKEAYAADGGGSVASGYGSSILFMMAMPFIVIAGFALRLWLARKNAVRAAIRT